MSDVTVKVLFGVLVWALAAGAALMLAGCEAQALGWTARVSKYEPTPHVVIEDAWLARKTRECAADRGVLTINGPNMVCCTVKRKRK